MNQFTPSDPFSRLSEIPKFGNGVGLHRVLWLCEDLRQTAWWSTLSAIKVTGSNGKGSVCAMTASILEALGIRCGVYTSPHLLKFNERFALDSQFISDEALTASVDWALGRRAEYLRLFPEDTVGAFELFTALGLYYYAQQAPPTLIAEAGIGGRYDPTRVLPGSLVAFTSLDLEHTELLGPTLELIAYDKADLCPAGGTLVTGRLEQDTLRRLHAYCALREVRLISLEVVSEVGRWHYTSDRMVVQAQVENLRFEELEIRLLGRHQVDNAMLAILLARHWLRQNQPRLAEAQTFIPGVYQGLAQVAWPGRFEKIHDRPPVYIDVGHTPHAIECLVQTAREVMNAKPLLLVVGVSYDKQVEKIVNRLLTLPQAVICTRAYHKGSPVSAIFQLVKAQRPDVPVFQAETIDEAMVLAQEYAQAKEMSVLVAGGLFLAVEARQVLHGKDPRVLRFF